MRIPSPIINALIIIVLILAIPVLAPIAMVLHDFDLRRLRAAAEKSACPACGRTLGVEALQLADELWLKHIVELRRTHPGVIFRLIRQVHAVCTHCQTNLCFCEDSKSFTKTETMEPNPATNPDAQEQTCYLVR